MPSNVGPERLAAWDHWDGHVPPPSRQIIGSSFWIAARKNPILLCDDASNSNYSFETIRQCGLMSIWVSGRGEPSLLLAGLIFSLCLAGVAAAQTNTSLGTGALVSNTTTGGANTAIGVNALASNTLGSFNTATGVQALVLNTTGNLNTASGVRALFLDNHGKPKHCQRTRCASGQHHGQLNTASGYGAYFFNTMGDGNAATGVQALSNNTTGSNNTALGSLASVLSGNLTNATAIGNGASVNASDQIPPGKRSGHGDRREGEFHG